MSLISEMKKRISPISWITECLASAEALQPPPSIFVRMPSAIPSSVIERLVSLISDKPSYSKLSSFSPLILVEPPCLERINLQNVTGVSASKCPVTDFQRMAQTRGVQEKIDKYKRDAEKLARDTLEGASDCVATKGEHVRVVRQAWDGAIWILNNGGSHKLAAVWKLDREAGRARFLDCNVETRYFNNAAIRQASEVACWLFSLRNQKLLQSTEFRDYCKHSEIEYRAIEFQDSYALAIRKNTSCYRKIFPLMSQAFCFSDFILSPHSIKFPTSREGELPEHLLQNLPRDDTPF